MENLKLYLPMSYTEWCCFVFKEKWPLSSLRYFLSFAVAVRSRRACSEDDTGEKVLAGFERRAARPFVTVAVYVCLCSWMGRPRAHLTTFIFTSAPPVYTNVGLGNTSEKSIRTAEFNIRQYQ